MTDVLGLELSHAVDVLERAGYEVQTQEVRSRKGVPGNERRVVRARALPEDSGGRPRICLTYAVFCTQVAQ